MTAKEFVGEAVEAARVGAGYEVTVRELIAHWGAKGRGSRVVRRIRTQLTKAKLRSEPDFRQVSLDTVVRLVLDSAHAGKRTEPDEDEREYGLTVGTLPSAGAGVVTVAANDSLHVAYTRMIVDDYSQLPVMSGPRTVRGAVTWRSLTTALLKSPSATLADALVDVSQVKYSDDLLKLVPRIVAEDFVLVLDVEDKVGGIVTAADLSELFAEQAESFLMLGEIDQRLRDRIRGRLALDVVQPLCERPDGRAVRSFDDLTMGDYQAILANPDCWTTVGWPLDRSEVHAVINIVREVRNDVTHFNPDPIDPERMAKVRGMLSLLREHG